MSQEVTALHVLKQLKTHGMPLVSRNRAFGICYQIDHTDDYYKIRKLIRKWPKYSGDSDYPIPDPVGLETSFDIYIRSDDYEMWSKDHPYGALRHELLDFLIKKLESET